MSESVSFACRLARQGRPSKHLGHMHFSMNTPDMRMEPCPTFRESATQRSQQPVSPMEAQTPQPIAALEAQITELAGHLNAGNHRFLVLIAEFDRRNGWSDCATQSCAHWLNWKCGIDMGAAREKLRVARALETLPRVSAAMARGELSYSKVRAITRVGTPETEELTLKMCSRETGRVCWRTILMTSSSPKTPQPRAGVANGWTTASRSTHCYINRAGMPRPFPRKRRVSHRRIEARHGSPTLALVC